jgi:hypothetical protein
MKDLQTRILPRDQIAAFIPEPRAQRAFEAVQQDVTAQNQALVTAQFLTLDAEPNLGAERIFTPVLGDLVGTDGGANTNYTLGLAATAVVAGTYGGNTKTVSVVVDAKGRLLGVTAYTLNTSNIAEGSNLYYTDARARAALSAGTGISYNSGTGVITNIAPDQTVALTGGTNITISGSYPNFTVTGSAGANPTATATDTATNGTATTFMRSDAAPAVQKASSSQFGIAKVDGSTITASGGVISVSNAVVDANGLLMLRSYTVAALPTPGVAGALAMVTDALAPSFLVAIVGGGTTKSPVFYDGSTWRAF